MSTLDGKREFAEYFCYISSHVRISSKTRQLLRFKSVSTYIPSLEYRHL